MKPAESAAARFASRPTTDARSGRSVDPGGLHDPFRANREEAE